MWWTNETMLPGGDLQVHDLQRLPGEGVDLARQPVPFHLRVPFLAVAVPLVRYAVEVRSGNDRELAAVLVVGPLGVAEGADALLPQVLLREGVAVPDPVLDLVAAVSVRGGRASAGPSTRGPGSSAPGGRGGKRPSKSFPSSSIICGWAVMTSRMKSSYAAAQYSGISPSDSTPGVTRVGSGPKSPCSCM